MPNQIIFYVTIQELSNTEEFIYIAMQLSEHLYKVWHVKRSNAFFFGILEVLNNIYIKLLLFNRVLQMIATVFPFFFP